jgi:phosphoribosyl-ATP pyrophosphohydrolase
MEFKKYVSEENQLKSVGEFKNMLSFLGVDLALVKLSSDFNVSQSKLKSFMLNDVCITDTEVYKKYFPIFLNIYSSNFNQFDLLKPFGFDDSDINELRSSTPDKEKVVNLISQKLGVSLKSDTKIKEIESKEIIFSVADKVDARINQEINDLFYFAEKEINKILNGICDYVKVDKQSDLGDDSFKNFSSMNLYKNAFEIYLKILRDIYSKENSIPIDRISNSALYPFFQSNYSTLLDSVNNKLRNDISHLNYDEREYYTREEIDEVRSDILLKSVTALIARNEFIFNFFNKSTNVNNKMENCINKIIDLINKKEK